MTLFHHVWQKCYRLAVIVIALAALAAAVVTSIKETMDARFEVDFQLMDEPQASGTVDASIDLRVFLGGRGSICIV